MLDIERIAIVLCQRVAATKILVADLTTQP